MTVDESSADQPAATAATPAEARTPAELALDRYKASMRRWRLGYAGAIVVVVAAVATWVAIAWSHGEIAHTTLRPADRPAPSVALQNPSPSLRQICRTQYEAVTAMGVFTRGSIKAPGGGL